MPNIKSAKKRVIVNEQKRTKQHAFKSAMRSTVKEFNKKADNNDVEGAKELLQLATKKVDKAADKKMIHKNTAARTKAKMQQRFNKIAQ
ncbi:small subunit ribosomal protein S20 [Salibacterium salarium]|uniref:Small ribosomal subunit protein bS20 n=1 Tax=Salibacterium salarium TaxID=284579 RepID=A0A428N7U3_9BACI|nr:30S ribosomal protein S20 [Salibacterium salarium]MDQ0299770.1 small subunit ribosomal protein S20 [Salibacterium salarium]RSL34463.1 30S ribosomal protein S20 [Salibacterium salarium]